MSRRRTAQTPAAGAIVDHFDQQMPRECPPVRHDDAEEEEEEEEGLVSSLVAEAAALEDTISQWWQELVVRYANAATTYCRVLAARLVAYPTHKPSLLWPSTCCWTMC